MLCDAQGAETALVASLRPFVERQRIGMLVLSTHAQPISGDALTHQRCLDGLQALGAEILVEHDVHESFSGDGLIVAAFGGVPLGWQEPLISRNRYECALFRNPLYDLAEAEEAAAQSLPASAFVKALDRQLLGHEADPDGLCYHLDLLEQTGDVDALVSAMTESAEFTGRVSAQREGRADHL